MQCKNHPDVDAVDRCVGCAESFCFNCLVPIHGQNYCGSCKVMALSGQPMIEEATIPCKEAKDALIISLVGMICTNGWLGIVLAPLAIAKAWKARQMIAANPRLTGSGKANAALILGLVGSMMVILNFYFKFKAM